MAQLGETLKSINESFEPRKVNNHFSLLIKVKILLSVNFAWFWSYLQVYLSKLIRYSTLNILFTNTLRSETFIQHKSQLKVGQNPASNRHLNQMVSRERKKSIQDSSGKLGRNFKDNVVSTSLLWSLIGRFSLDLVSSLDITLKRFGKGIKPKKWASRCPRSH